MTVRDWISLLSDMDPSLEVRAMDLRGTWVTVSPHVAKRPLRYDPVRRQPVQRRFVKVVREGDEWGHG